MELFPPVAHETSQNRADNFVALSERLSADGSFGERPQAADLRKLRMLYLEDTDDSRRSRYDLDLLKTSLQGSQPTLQLLSSSSIWDFDLNPNNLAGFFTYRYWMWSTGGIAGLAAQRKEVGHRLDRLENEWRSLRTLQTEIEERICLIDEDRPTFDQFLHVGDTSWSSFIQNKAETVDLEDTLDSILRRLRKISAELISLQSAVRIVSWLVNTLLGFARRLSPTHGVFQMQRPWFLYHANIAPPAGVETVAAFAF